MSNSIKMFKRRIFKVFLIVFIFLSIFLFFQPVLALPRGTILYKTSANGKMYGLNYNQIGLSVFSKYNFYPGGVGLYLGKKNKVPMVLEVEDGYVREIPAKFFVNLNKGERFLGAKIPKDFKPEQIRILLELAKTQLGERYDWTYHEQKGPSDFEWTSVGLVEKIYESLDKKWSLAYKADEYAIDITPDGFDDKTKINQIGDCLSLKTEFSRIHSIEDEGLMTFAFIKSVKQIANQLSDGKIIDFNDFDFNVFGKKNDQNNYIFFPYTQFIQPTLKDVPLDIEISSNQNYFLDIPEEKLKKDRYLAFGQRIFFQLAKLTGKTLLEKAIPGNSVINLAKSIEGQIENLENVIYLASQGKVNLNLREKIKEKLQSDERLSSLTGLVSQAKASVNQAKTYLDQEWKVTKEVDDRADKGLLIPQDERDEKLEIDSYQGEEEFLVPNFFLEELEQELAKNEPFFSESDIVINEIYPWPDKGEFEWIELYNNTSKDIPLENWTIEDKTEKKFKLNDFVLKAKDFLVLEQGKHFRFNLNNQGDVLTLRYNGEVIDEIRYGQEDDNLLCHKSQSIARIYDGEDTDKSEDFSVTVSPTPGTKNVIKLPEDKQELAEDREKNFQEQNKVKETKDELKQIQDKGGKSDPRLGLEEQKEQSKDYSETFQEGEYLDIVFSEIAWMGTKASPRDEWIELYNNTNKLINLDGFVIESLDKKLVIALKGVIFPHSYFLLERSDDSTIKSIKADQIYQGSLLNSGQDIALKDAFGNIIDFCQAQSGWPAGSSSLRKSMERIYLDEAGVSSNWHTFSGQGSDKDSLGYFILGTPRKENSLPVDINNSANTSSENEVQSQDDVEQTNQGSQEYQEQGDNILPITSIISHPSLLTNQKFAYFEFKASELADFKCSLDNQDWEDCISPKVYSNLGQGKHLFSVYAIDKAGNKEGSPKVYQWEIDLTGPGSSIQTQGYFSSLSWPGKIQGEFFLNSVSSTTSTLSLVDVESVKISLQRQSDGKYLNQELKWEESPFWLLAQIKGNKWEFPLDKELLLEDVYYIQSIAYDLAGNKQDIISLNSFVFDDTPPDIFDLEIQDKGNRQIRINWQQAEDNLSGIDYYELYQKIGDSWQRFKIKENYFDLGLDWAKKYSFYLKAYDKSGNVALSREIEYFSSVPQVLITEIQVGDKEFVELYNNEEEDILLEDWFLSYYSPENNWDEPFKSWQFKKGSKIKSKSYYLIGFYGIDSFYSDWQPYSGYQLNNQSGSLVVYPFNPKESLDDLEYFYIDLVGWGDNMLVKVKEGETSPCPYDSLKEQSLERKRDIINGYIDTDNNKNDFFIQENPNPTNSNGSDLSFTGLWGWKNKKKIVVTNPSLGNLSDYPVRIELPFYQGMNQDFSDIRFSLIDKSGLLDYWIEDYNSEKAIVWVKIPYLPYFSEVNLYVYWNNPSAVYIGNPKKVFSWYDDFNGLTKNEYTIFGEDNFLTWDTANSRLNLIRNDHQWLIWPKDLSLENFVLEIKASVDKTAGFGPIWGIKDEGNYFSFVFNWTSGTLSYKQNNQDVPLFTTSASSNVNWIRLTRYQTKHFFEFSDDNNNFYSFEENLVDPYPLANGGIGFFAKVGCGFPWIDSFLVRKYTQPEPYASLQ